MYQSVADYAVIFNRVVALQRLQWGRFGCWTERWHTETTSYVPDTPPDHMRIFPSVHSRAWPMQVLVYTAASGRSATFSALLSFLFSSLWIRRQDQILITAACSFVVWAQDNPSPCCYHHIPSVRSAHLRTKCSWFQSNLVWWDSEHVFYGRAQFLFREDPLINLSLPHFINCLFFQNRNLICRCIFRDYDHPLPLPSTKCVILNDNNNRNWSRCSGFSTTMKPSTRLKSYIIIQQSIVLRPT